MAYQVKIRKHAVSYYKRLPAHLHAEVKEALHTLETNPSTGPAIEQMTGNLREFHRIDISHAIRIVYKIHAGQQLVDVRAIGPRGDVYKKI